MRMPIPTPLEDVIDHVIHFHLISENKRPNSCVISFFVEEEFSQPFLKPPHLEQPISTLLLSESTMVFGRTLVCDNDGNYKGPLMLSLNKGSLLVMRRNSTDMARHVSCQSPTRRISHIL
ncbi:putative alpha-ketoglutarate-dependent dioxygenase AlkB-like superfamily [Helianthus anomalus]